MARLADIAIDLFVGLCVLSRASTLARTNDSCGEHAINIAKMFAQQAKRRMNQHLRRVMRNEDEDLKSLAAAVSEAGNYPWEVWRNAEETP